ncbi:hypothetical protein ALC60_01756 [Trachymyrmex zeteki]|uniref:Uncharacterized protein n=1 Tax=Mycetomoellerius zeteki TaxID=64791 RepID=A0A151XFQ7_9HYME|nr:hypothetical protein ALC60_01756 [Trachymyrmex zeteki]
MEDENGERKSKSGGVGGMRKSQRVGWACQLVDILNGKLPRPSLQSAATSEGQERSKKRACYPWNLALTRPRCLKYSECVVALVAAFDAAANGRSRTQTLVVEGDVLAIDWQPWPRSRQGSGMQIHGRDCGLRRRPASIVTTVVSHQ